VFNLSIHYTYFIVTFNVAVYIKYKTCILCKSHFHSYVRLSFQDNYEESALPVKMPFIWHRCILFLGTIVIFHAIYCMFYEIKQSLCFKAVVTKWKQRSTRNGGIQRTDPQQNLAHRTISKRVVEVTVLKLSRIEI
jgi:hypothetical protein